MIPAVLNAVITVLLAFTALGIAYAVVIGWRRPAPADPFSQPFGEMPGFTQAQLDALVQASARRAARDPLRRSFASRPMPPIVDSERNVARYEAELLFRRPSSRIEESVGVMPRPADGGFFSSFPSGLAAVRNLPAWLTRFRHARWERVNRRCQAGEWRRTAHLSRAWDCVPPPPRREGA
jgi:hypothetical protein